MCIQIYMVSWHELLIVERYGEKQNTCDYLSKDFADTSALIIHQRIHTGEKPYSCDQCNKAFSQRQQLTLHQIAHTGEKPYSCDHCNKAFADNRTLITHQRTHTGEKPYICSLQQDFCTEKSSYKSSENPHWREALQL